ncbi:MAG TPA: hypothetical protein VGB95_01800 [Chitinophagales bacterium]
MTTAIIISLVGALTSLIVSFVGAWLANRNSIVLQTRKLKEAHYAEYIEALHNHCADNTTETLKKYVFVRDKLFLIASEKVVNKMLLYENKGVGSSAHDLYLTELIKEIRSDLSIRDKQFPLVSFKRA